MTTTELYQKKKKKTILNRVFKFFSEFNKNNNKITLKQCLEIKINLTKTCILKKKDSTETESKTKTNIKTLIETKISALAKTVNYMV